jgi:hypothetical protein
MPEPHRAASNGPAPAASLLDIPIHRRPAAGVVATAPSGNTAAEPAPDMQPFVESEQGPANAHDTAAFPPPADLHTYWRRLARVGIPDVGQLDAATISANWPYALLLRGRVRAPMDIVRVFRPAAMAGDGGTTGGSHPLAGDLCSQVSSWALTLARDAMMRCEPVVAVERFRLSGHTRGYRGLALPCHRAGSTSAYVLLYLHVVAEGE